MTNENNTDCSNYENKSTSELVKEICCRRTPVPPTPSINVSSPQFMAQHSQYTQTKRYDVYQLWVNKISRAGWHSNKDEQYFMEKVIPWQMRTTDFEHLYEDKIVIAPGAASAVLAEAIGLWSEKIPELEEHTWIAVIPPEAVMYAPTAVEELKRRCDVLFDCMAGAGRYNANGNNAGTRSSVTFCETISDSTTPIFALDNDTETVFFDISRLTHRDLFYDTGEVLGHARCPGCGGELHKFVKHPKREGLWHVGCTEGCGWHPGRMLQEVELGERIVSTCAHDGDVKVWEY